MKKQQLVLLTATVVLSTASCPLEALAKPSGTKASKAEAEAKGAAAEAASVAKMTADIAKQEGIKKQKHDQILKAAQADIDAGNYSAAETKLLQAIAIAESLNDNEQKLLTRTRLADCYLKQKKYKEAEKQYKESYDSNIQLYRGNYLVLLDDAKGLSEVFKATGRSKEADKILSSAKEARKTRYSVAGVDDGDLFATSYQSLRDAVAKKDTAAVSKMFQYPVAIRWNGEKGRKINRTFSSAKELLANYNLIFTADVKDLIATTPEKDLWSRDSGIMLGGGLVWLTNVQLVKVAGNSTYQIHALTINADMPKK